MTNSGANNFLRVRDLMTEQVFTIAASTSLEDAARALSFHRVTGAPVIDAGRVVGVISKTDLADPRRCPGNHAGTVRDAMTPTLRAVRPSDSAMMAVVLMAMERVHRVVVVSERGKLAGIVTAMDVMMALARGEQLAPVESEWAESERHSDPAVAISYVNLQAVELLG
jgi:CBS-domain-containing membrane protein